MVLKQNGSTVMLCTPTKFFHPCNNTFVLEWVSCWAPNLCEEGMWQVLG